MNRVREILLVEDEATTALLASKMLSSRGFSVRHCLSGEAAMLALSQGYVPELILMDIDLGAGMDGTQTAAEILKIYNLPIVFHTSHTEQEIVEKVKGITRYGYVVKNSGQFVLVEAITMAFELFAAHQETLEKEERFETAVKVSYDLVFEWDVKSKKLTWFGSIDTLLGYEEGFISHSFSSWLASLHPEDLPMVQKEIARLEKSSEALLIRYRIRRKDGSWTTLESKGLLLLDKNRLPVKWIGVCTDLTEFLAHQEELYKKNLAIECSMNAIAFADLQGKLFYINASFLKMWGYSSPEEVLGRAAVNFWQDPVAAAGVLQRLGQRETIHATLVGKRKDQSTMHVMLSANAVLD